MPVMPGMEVRKHRTRTASQDGRHPPPLSGKPLVAKRIDPLMQ